jgi:hypothetical protein
MIYTLVVLILVLLAIAKAWRFFLEASDDVSHIRLLEPWYWLIFLNLILTLISSNYDYPFIMTGFLLQLALSIWFAVSLAWIIQSCRHKTIVLNQSWFVKGKTVKFCHRCGTRLPKEFHGFIVKDNSWQSFLFQVPPHLFEYVVFWVLQSAMVLIALFLALRLLKNPILQHRMVLLAIILVVLAPPFIYFLGRFRRYLSETKGMIWWDDFKNSLITWMVVIGLAWCLLHFL